MKRFFTKTALAVATVLCLGAAHAAVIDFENVDTTGLFIPPLMNNGGTIAQGPMLIQIYDGGGSTDTTALTGSLIGPAYGATCDSTMICPSGNTGDYLAALNNGIVYMQERDGYALTLHSFDAAFIAPSSGVPAGAFGLLAVEADRTDGTYSVGAFTLDGPDASGSTSFSNFLASDAVYGLFNGSTGSITDGDIFDYQFLEYYCSSSSLSSCTYDKTDLSQFALDNVSITAVPEPSSWALLTFGVAGLAAAARRRRSV